MAHLPNGLYDLLLDEGIRTLALQLRDAGQADPNLPVELFLLTLPRWLLAPR